MAPWLLQHPPGSSNSRDQGVSERKASGAAVEALEIHPGDHVLDLYAAPGAKLCMIADILKDSGTLTATDISLSRLVVSRAMLLKYGLGSRCRLFLADGTTFSHLPLRDNAQCNGKPEIAVVANGHTYVESNIYGEWKSRKTAKEEKAPKRLKYLEDALERVCGRESELVYYGKSSGVVRMKVSDVFSNACSGDALDNGYDKVLVDAECTHDGSLKHIYKYDQWGWDTFERRLFNSERMATLTSLQVMTTIVGDMPMGPPLLLAILYPYRYHPFLENSALL